MIARGDSFQMKWNQTLLGDYFPHIGIVWLLAVILRISDKMGSNTTWWLSPFHMHCNDCLRWFFAFQMKWDQTPQWFFLIPLFSDQTLGLFSSLLTTYDNRSKRLFSNGNWSNRCHYAADYMSLLQDRRRGIQWSIEAVFAFRLCLIVRPV